MCFYLNKPLLFNKNKINISELIVIKLKSGSLCVTYNDGNKILTIQPTLEIFGVSIKSAVYLKNQI